MASDKKQYGLIIPNKKKVIGPARPKPAVFGDDSSSDEEGDVVRGKYGSSVWRENKKNAQRLETHGSVVKALSEDPSVFEYDSLYDKMQEDKRKADPRLQKKDNKPKYIAQLKRTAEKRKLEQELIYERKVQREMEREGLNEEDTEAYVTTAYKKKLEERKKMEEELRREEELEKINDVTKQKDLSKFQKHLFNQIASGPSAVKEQSSTQKSPDKDKSRLRDTDRKDTQHKDGGRDSYHSEGRRSSEHERRRSFDNERRRQTSDSRDRRSSTQSDGRRLSHTENTDRDNDASPGVQTRTESTSSDNLKSPSDEAAAQKEVEKEERRKAASAKRTNEEAQLSARERYLARKKMKLAQSTVTT